MLIKCPECELQVSDKAFICPHCGYPLKPESKPSLNRSRKRRRLPNGFGQISEIKGRNLRKPFRAMITVGKNEFGRPICKPLKPESYFETYNDAYAALMEYNKNPYDLSPSITVKEVYELWSEKHFKTLSVEESKKGYERAWKYCSNIYDLRMKELRVRHMKDCMENGTCEVRGNIQTPNTNMKKLMKLLFNQLFDYAVEYELTDKNYARSFSIDKDLKNEVRESKQSHLAYTDDEISRLWANASDDVISTLLIQCYSGWRPQELGNIKLDNVDLVNWTFNGGMKTAAGINRTVPIHTKIRSLVEKKYHEARQIGSEYLILNSKGKQMTYHGLYYRFENIKSELDLDPRHSPHDGRKFFITQAKKFGVDEYAIKYLVGHTITDLTESVYTERSIEWLRDEIEKIK